MHLAQLVYLSLGLFLKTSIDVEVIQLFLNNFSLYEYTKIYPFTSRWTFELFTSFGYYKQAGRAFL